MSEFKGKAGTIYVEKSKEPVDTLDGKSYEVWYENFCIIGTGRSELEALQDAALHAADIGLLIATAMSSAQAASGD